MLARLAGTTSSEGRQDQLYRWLLLTGDRGVIVSALTVTTFAVTFVVTGGYPLGEPVSGDLVLRLATALVGGLLPFITLVLTINQLALSMELGSIFHLSRRLDSMREFRSDVVDVTDRGASPAEPAALLETLFDGVNARASALRDSDDDGLVEYGDSLEAETAAVQRQLSATDGRRRARRTARRYNPGAHLHTTERFREVVESDEDAALFDELERFQEQLDIAQKYFWMVYVEDEMAKLARHVLYTGFVALLAGVALSLGVDRLVALGVGERSLALVVATGITLEILPFAILFAYMLRIATVARTTSGFGPFVTGGPGWD